MIFGLRNSVKYGMIKVPNKTEFLRIESLYFVKMQALLSHYFQFVIRISFVWRQSELCFWAYSFSVVRHFYLPSITLKEEFL